MIDGQSADVVIPSTTHVHSQAPMLHTVPIDVVVYVCNLTDIDEKVNESSYGGKEGVNCNASRLVLSRNGGTTFDNEI